MIGWLHLRPSKRCFDNAGVAQLVEHDLAKVGVASSSLVSRSLVNRKKCEIGTRTFLFVAIPIYWLMIFLNARVVELVDTQDLKSCG